MCQFSVKKDRNSTSTDVTDFKKMRHILRYQFTVNA